MDGIEQIAAIVGALLAGFGGIWLGGKRGDRHQAEKVGEHVAKVMLGRDHDPTPKHVDDHGTGAFAIVVRAELAPVLREQRRQTRALEVVEGKLELLTMGHEQLTERGHEISGRLAKVEAKAEVEAFAERIQGRTVDDDSRPSSQSSQ